MHEDHTQPEKEQIDYQKVIAELNALEPYKSPEQIHAERLGDAIRAASKRGIGADKISMMLKSQGVNLSASFLRKHVLANGTRKKPNGQQKSSAKASVPPAQRESQKLATNP